MITMNRLATCFTLLLAMGCAETKGPRPPALAANKEVLSQMHLDILGEENGAPKHFIHADHKGAGQYSVKLLDELSSEDYKIEIKKTTAQNLKADTLEIKDFEFSLAFTLKTKPNENQLYQCSSNSKSGECTVEPLVHYSNSQDKTGKKLWVDLITVGSNQAIVCRFKISPSSDAITMVPVNSKEDSKKQDSFAKLPTEPAKDFIAKNASKKYGIAFDCVSAEKKLLIQGVFRQNTSEKIDLDKNN